ncbi:hypothetical protein NKI56_29135 [Mesorhizobium sp. M0622]|uniref:hypothetical protein n=1 Tax=Mesorhizobium sp. M0622 TaxID=2956975 RepID=UPI00333B3EA6
MEAIVFMKIDVCCFPHGGRCEASQFLPPLHDGHAPIGLHLAFQDALEFCDEWVADADEPRIQVDGRHLMISSIFCRMIDCTDLLPRRTLDALFAILRPADRVSLEGGRSTFADGARLMLALCYERRGVAAAT